MYNNMFNASKEAERISNISSNLTNNKYNYNEESLMNALYHQKGKILGGITAGGVGGVLAYNHMAIKSVFNKMIENADILANKAMAEGDELMTNVFTYMNTLKDKGVSSLGIFTNTCREFKENLSEIVTKFTEYLPFINHTNVV